jgi:hypothetical protein
MQHIGSHEGRECCQRIDFGPNETSQRSARKLAKYGMRLARDEFRYPEAVMEAEIEPASAIFTLSLAMPFIVQDLSVMAGLIDRFQYARVQFVLLGSYTLYPSHARGLPGAIFCGAARASARGLAAWRPDLPLFANSNDHVLSAPR